MKTKKTWYRLLGVCASIFLFIVVGQAEPKNFHVVEKEKIYRSAAPTYPDLNDLYNKYGIRTIIDLRGASSVTRKEASWAGDFKINYFNFSESGFFAPNRSKADKVESILLDPSAWPILIHCARGADRTGTTVARYRMQVQCWSYDAAISEMYFDGAHQYDWSMFKYLKQFERSDCKQPSDMHFSYRPYPLWRWFVPFLPLIDALNAA